MSLYLLKKKKKLKKNLYDCVDTKMNIIQVDSTFFPLLILKEI